MGIQVAWAQPAATAALDVQREQREQIQQWQRQAQQPADLPMANTTAAWLPPVAGEQPCVHVRAVHITVHAGEGGGARHAVPQALQSPAAGFLGECLGATSLQRLCANLQAQLQALGYVTSTLQLPEQRLDDGTLRLVLHWGLVGRIHVQAADGAPALVSLPGANALAVQPGMPLNLRDIEHTLENLARLPSQRAQFVIEPGDAPQHSDLRIVVLSQKPWRFSLGLDGNNMPPDKPWDVQAQAWWDGPLAWSDQLMVSVSGAPSAAGGQGQRRHSLYVQWSLPWGRHMVTASASTARNSRSIAGGVGRFTEGGAEAQASLRWQWTPWRGADWRTQLSAGWTERRSQSRIDNVELLSRRRVASELALGATHWRRLACGEVSAELDASHTVRLARVADFQDLQAPMPRQWRVQLDWRCTWPASAPGTGTPPAGWAWAASAWTQATERPFDGTDLHTLGSRYTVRGHSPLQALQGRRISVLRLGATAPGWQTAPGLALQPWLGWDAGRLDRAAGPTVALAGASRNRQAAVLGLRWQAGPATGELTWARAVGPSPVPRHAQWQAQVAWWL